MQLKKQYKCIDLFKFIMSILVVAIHTHPLDNCNNIIIKNIFNSLNLIAVPYFFIATGYFIGKKFSNDFNDNKNLNIVKKYFKKICKLYIVWSIIYIPLAIYNYVMTSKNIIKSILYYIKGLLLVGEHFDSWHLWYLLSIIYSLLIIMFCIKKNISKNKLLIISLIIWTFGITTNFILGIDSQISILKIYQKIISIIFTHTRIFTGIGYITIGILINYKEIKITKNKYIIFIISLIFEIFTKNIIQNIFLMIITTILFIITLKIDIKSLTEEICKKLRILSSVTYFTHMMFYFIYTLLIGKVNKYGIDSFIVSLSLTWILGILIIKFKENKYIKFIFN